VAALDAWLVFEDEAGFSMTPPTARTWSRRGHTPVVRVRGRSRRRLSVAALVCYKPGERSRLIYRPCPDARPDGRKSFWKDYRDLIQTAHQQLGGPIVLVWDNLNTHLTAGTRRYIAERDWLTVYQLPPYAADRPVRGPCLPEAIKRHPAAVTVHTRSVAASWGVGHLTSGPLPVCRTQVHVTGITGGRAPALGRPRSTASEAQVEREAREVGPRALGVVGRDRRPVRPGCLLLDHLVELDALRQLAESRMPCRRCRVQLRGGFHGVFLPS
jgi:hypothetical protein